MKSQSRMIDSSTQPRRADAKRPRDTPIESPITTATTPTTIEFWAPAMMMDSTSRPN